MRGLDALVSGSDSKPGIQSFGSLEESKPGLLGQLGNAVKKLTGKNKVPKTTQQELQAGVQPQKALSAAGAAKLTEAVQKAAGEMIVSGLPEGGEEEDLLLQQQGEQALEQTALQQQQQQVQIQQQQIQQQQQLIEEKRKQQRELDRRRRKQFKVPKESLIKKTAKEGLEPLDAGLLPTPFGPVWACYRLYKWLK